MLNHLKMKHPTVKIEANINDQPSVSTMFADMNKKKTCDKKTSEKITELIREFLIENMLPFRIVDTQSFKNLIQFFQPAYSVPSRVCFSNQIQRQYEERKSDLMEHLRNAESVSLTTDSWMSLNTNSFTTVTAHFIETDWRLKSAVLATVHKNEDHTAQNIKEELDDIIKNFHLENKVKACVHDNAANVVQGVARSTYVAHSLNCVAHTIQLAVNKGLNDIDLIKTATAACSRLVGHFKHSYKATNYLTEKQIQLKMPQHKLLQKCATRWNSTLDMYERLLEQRWAACAVLSDRRCTKISEARILEPKDLHWQVIEELIPVLQPLKVATTAVSHEKSVSISCVAPIIVSLIRKHLNESENDSQVVKKYKKIVKEDLQRRFAELFNCERCTSDNLSVYLIAAYLDPKHKHFAYFSEEERANIFKCMARITETEAKHGGNGTDEVRCDDNEARRKKAKTVNDLSFLLGENYGSQSQNDSVAVVELECQSYSKILPPDGDVNVLEWWSQNESSFPHLAQLARRYLATPATSVPSERIFSAAGRLMTKLRNRLSPRKTDMILFLNKNKD